MRAIRLLQTGGPEVLQLEEVPKPEPGAGQALVRLHRAGLNFIDIYFRRGQNPIASFPYTPGLEGAGVVESLGPGVEGVKVGGRVAYVSTPNSYAEYVVVPVERLIPVPDGVDWDAAAALPLQGMTAHYLLHSAHETKPGETVLIHAAAGGMGALAVQIAKRMGARVFGTVSTEEKAKIAREAGCDEVILYTQQDFAAEAKRLTGGKGVDFVIDSVGKTTIPKSLEAIRVRGQVIICGSASGPADPIGPNSLQNGAKTLSGSSLAFYTQDREELLWRSGDVFKWYTDGSLRLRIDSVFPLAEAAAAHHHLESRAATGKVLLRTED
ncbi:MAG: quinone oxidoreductase [Chloroflexi bacterium]|nr:quinone oxidoreductase [Chloroflexota bacterium]